LLEGDVAVVDPPIEEQVALQLCPALLVGPGSPSFQGLSGEFVLVINIFYLNAVISFGEEVQEGEGDGLLMLFDDLGGLDDGGVEVGNVFFVVAVLLVDPCDS
jgi:hypothetical protein